MLLWVATVGHFCGPNFTLYAVIDALYIHNVGPDIYDAWAYMKQEAQSTFGTRTLTACRSVTVNVANRVRKENCRCMRWACSIYFTMDQEHLGWMGRSRECDSDVISSLLRIAASDGDDFWMESTCVTGRWQWLDMCSACGHHTPQLVLSFPKLSVSCSVSFCMLLCVCRQADYIRTPVYPQWPTLDISTDAATDLLMTMSCQ